ncbi:MAG: MBL fold metallo-hydrolase [Candidatus Latescibacteria bacterium]|jgi:phosphoribosyl 1,2-cyclic phosphodiesterase|nr:MBL fold metallo-hydrolase [Candidatus Latescibacterota bacterium]
MKVKFWGVRGTIPTPVSSEDIEAKIVDMLVSADDHPTPTPESARDFLRSRTLFERGTIGGNTSCVEVLGGGGRLVIDAGSGIKDLGRSLMQEGFDQGTGRLDILMSHTHWDHIMGFPVFQPAFVPGNQIRVHGGHSRLRQRFRNQHHAFNFPITLEYMPADIQFKKLTPQKKRRLGPFGVTPFLLDHPGDSYAYRIELGDAVLIYATDASYNDLRPEAMQPYHDFYRDADALIFDAFFELIESFEKSHWGHSSPFIGVDIALHAGVKRLVLFHHDPFADDQKLEDLLESTQNYLEHVAPDSTREVIIAHEGMVLTL